MPLRRVRPKYESAKKMDCENNAGNFHYRNIQSKNPKPDWRGLGEVGTNTLVLVNQAGRAKQEPATTFEITENTGKSLLFQKLGYAIFCAMR